MVSFQSSCPSFARSLSQSVNIWTPAPLLPATATCIEKVQVVHNAVALDPCAYCVETIEEGKRGYGAQKSNTHKLAVLPEPRLPFTVLSESLD